MPLHVCWRAFVGLGVLACCWILYNSWAPEPALLPTKLEPITGVSQCNYDILRAFAGWAEAQQDSIRYTLGAGTLLGAMRTQPTGLLQWEHDVDLYIPAKNAAAVLRLLIDQCSGADEHEWKSPWCSVLEYKGLVEADGATPCCGFGFKLYHRRSEACQLDVLVLGESSAPLMHGEGPLWPPQVALAVPFYKLQSMLNNGQKFYTIPEDVNQKLLMADEARWCKDGEDWSWCGGPPVSYFQGEYFLEQELFPVKWIDFYDFKVPIPRDAWSSLNRTYGTRCSYIARLSEHGSIEFDTRLAVNAHLKLPAQVSLADPTVQRRLEQQIQTIQLEQEQRVEQEARQARQGSSEL